jgi:hypothetical protein
MSRKFVLVTATSDSAGLPGTSCAGIKKLKRGVTLEDFVQEYTAGLEVQEITKREDTVTAFKRHPDKVLTWSFTEYHEDDLLRAVSHLTKDELIRDIQEILPLKETV